MRAAAILGLGIASTDLRTFEIGGCSFQLGLPASAATLDAVLVFGGDGTLHRHLAGLVTLQLPVLVVPKGSGNDFARSLGISTTADALAAWQRFVIGEGRLRTVDLGVVKPSDAAGEKEFLFACVAGVGLDTATASIANGLPRWLRARGGYAWSLPLALSRFVPPLVQLETDGSPHSTKPRVLAAFANTPQYGGGMRIAPRADMSDGLLDACLVGTMSKRRLLRLFPSVYGGKHLRFAEVEYLQARHFNVTTAPATDVYADGEFVCRTPVEISVAASALRVIA